MAILEQKIEQFKREVGNPDNLNNEQKKIYYAFTKTSGSRIYVRVTDKFGQSHKLYMPTGTYLYKIMTKHYNGEKGTVTANEILNLLDVIKTGNKRRDLSNGHLIYQKKYEKHGITYFSIVNVSSDGKDSYLLSFYTNRGYIK